VSSLCHDVIRLIHYDMCFLVCRARRVSWLAAAQLCESLDAQLALLLTKDVHDALVDHVRPLQHAAAAEDEYWIGLRKARWIWNTTGEFPQSSNCQSWI